MQIVKYSKFFLILSVVLLVPGIISLFVNGLNLSIDFVGGSFIEYKINGSNANRDEISQKIENSYKEAGVTIQEIKPKGDNSITLKIKDIDVAKNEEVRSKVTTENANVSMEVFETVGPSVGEETTRNSFLAVAVASIGILLYIAFAFRNVPKPYSSFRFGGSAIIAMLHDALMVVGIFSIVGKALNLEVDVLFITAVLTIIGFSVHDTIVVFDRIRENLQKLPSSWDFEKIVNFSLVETLGRSISTSLTVILTLLSLFILGGESIKHFVLALLIGIVSGTYSSIFTAAPILMFWEKRKR